MRSVLYFRCDHEGCNEQTAYEVNSKKEAKELRKRYENNPYMCVRHSYPDEILSRERPVITTVKTCSKSKDYPNLKGLYWDSGSSFAYGDGFRVFADDFPVGTQLVVTAELVFPGIKETIQARIAENKLFDEMPWQKVDNTTKYTVDIKTKLPETEVHSLSENV